MKSFTVKIASTTDNLTEDSLNYLLENVKGTPFKNEKGKLIGVFTKGYISESCGKKTLYGEGYLFDYFNNPPEVTKNTSTSFSIYCSNGKLAEVCTER